MGTDQSKVFNIADLPEEIRSKIQVSKTVRNNFARPNLVWIGNPCWEWTGTKAVNRNSRRIGYGQLYYQGHHVQVHRFVYESLVGPIEKGFMLDHLCENTICCNPEHLEPCSNSDNARRNGLSVINLCLYKRCAKQDHHRNILNADFLGENKILGKNYDPSYPPDMPRYYIGFAKIFDLEVEQVSDLWVNRGRSYRLARNSKYGDGKSLFATEYTDPLTKYGGRTPEDDGLPKSIRCFQKEKRWYLEFDGVVQAESFRIISEAQDSVDDVVNTATYKKYCDNNLCGFLEGISIP